MADAINVTSAEPVDSAYQTPAQPTGTSGKAIAALVCGILSFVVFGVILGLVAVGLGVSARKELETQPGRSGAGLALAGIITGAIGFVASIVFLVLFFS
ncbi:MAG: DUF4190 domain-containing protein [Solirubrobacteraceae bacterium]